MNANTIGNTAYSRSVLKAKTRYEVGLQELQNAAAAVVKMQERLTSLQPTLVEAGEKVDQQMAIVQAESADVAEVEKVVQKDEEVANKQAAAAQAIKDECDHDLGKAIPILKAAEAALETLTPAVRAVFGVWNCLLWFVNLLMML